MGGRYVLSRDKQYTYTAFHSLLSLLTNWYKTPIEEEHCASSPRILSQNESVLPAYFKERGVGGALLLGLAKVDSRVAYKTTDEPMAVRSGNAVASSFSTNRATILEPRLPLTFLWPRPCFSFVSLSRLSCTLWRSRDQARLSLSVTACLREGT
jgi:hypothetical protein